MITTELPCRRNRLTFDVAGAGTASPEPGMRAQVEDDYREAVEACRSLCATCPLLEACRADLVRQLRAGWAPYGVRAGLDETEQAAIAEASPMLCQWCERHEVPNHGAKCDSCRTDAVVAARRRELMAVA